MTPRILAVLMLASITTVVSAQEMPEMPSPQKEHEWLRQLEGEWNADVKITMGPDAPVMETSGTETGRMVGGFWAITESKSTMMGQPFHGVMTIGYNPETKKYQGTWVDSMGSRIWEYEGAVDDSGKVLTLDTEGPCPLEDGKIIPMRETIEFKSPDHKVFKSQAKRNGEWTTHLTVNSRRKN